MDSDVCLDFERRQRLGVVEAIWGEHKSDDQIVRILEAFHAAGELALVTRVSASADQLRDSLQRLGSVGADDLLALEVIWQPEGEGESLSASELVTQYPDLQHL